MQQRSLLVLDTASTTSEELLLILPTLKNATLSKDFGRSLQDEDLTNPCFQALPFNITVARPVLIIFFIKTVEKVYKIWKNSGKKSVNTVQKSAKKYKKKKKENETSEVFLI